MNHRSSFPPAGRRWLLALLVPLVPMLAVGAVQAAETTPYLPPAEVVARVLRSHPAVLASVSQVTAEEANRTRLEAGDYEWNVRLGSQRRRSNPVAAPAERFSEWNAGLERPLRLPGKAADDAALGSAGVALAETGRGDALHEAGRELLRTWFLWLKESAAAAQWDEQVRLLSLQAAGTQRRLQLGDAARLETIQAEAALAQAEAQAVQAHARRESAAEDLRRRFPGLPVVEPAASDTPADPPAIAGGPGEWVDAIVAHSHELGLARGEALKAQIAAARSGRDRLPDPTLGLHVSGERGGEDRIVGAYVSIPLPGDGRRAVAEGALAQAAAASHREAAAQRKVTAEAAALHQSATAALAALQASRSAAERLVRAAEMSARAYALGEGSLVEVLAARRLANEAQLAARLARLEAFERSYRLLFDAHRLWADGEMHLAPE